MDLREDDFREPTKEDSPEEIKPETPLSFIWVLIKEIAFILIIAYILAFLLKTLIIQPFMIPSGSMEPTLYAGDYVLVSKFIYKLKEPARGDIVVFEAPFDSQKDYIKRVIAAGGESVEVKSGTVYINGKKIEEPYVINAQDLSNFGPIIVPEDKLFVMGDNRPNSQDSRIFGPIPENVVLGKAILIYWPLQRAGKLR